ncbi:hypothetical protein [Ornithinimicrobium kibberense]|uniref:hypothetical protein n=1 Tax=Ornithinimicrobium kibberense TaxID=282060 RepID=UPI003612AA65
MSGPECLSRRHVRRVLEHRRVAHQEHLDVHGVVQLHPLHLTAPEQLHDGCAQGQVPGGREAQGLQVQDPNPQTGLPRGTELLEHGPLRTSVAPPVPGEHKVQVPPRGQPRIPGAGPPPRLRHRAVRPRVQVCRRARDDLLVPGRVESLVGVPGAVPPAPPELRGGERLAGPQQQQAGVHRVHGGRAEGCLEPAGELGVGRFTGRVEEADTGQDQVDPEQQRGSGEDPVPVTGTHE